LPSEPEHAPLSIFDATLTALVEAPTGTFESSVHYGGPVTLVRHDSAWNVADYAVSGRLRSESLQLVDGELAEGQIRLRVTSLELRGDAALSSLHSGERSISRCW
jgi:hypothetical protein